MHNVTLDVLLNLYTKLKFGVQWVKNNLGVHLLESPGVVDSLPLERCDPEGSVLLECF